MTLLAEVLADSPSILWECDGATTAAALTDTSGNGRDGAAVGSITPNQASIIPLVAGKSLAFPGSGSNYGNRAFDAALDVGTGDFVIEFWCVSNNVTSNYCEFFSRDTGASGFGQIVYLNIGTGALRLWVGNTPVNGSTRISDGLLHHIVVERASGVLKAYVDRNVDLSISAGGNTDRSSPIHLGLSDASYTPLLGKMQFFAYYTHAIGAARVTAHYYAGVGVPPNYSKYAYMQVDENVGLYVPPPSPDGLFQADENVGRVISVDSRGFLQVDENVVETVPATMRSRIGIPIV